MTKAEVKLLCETDEKLNWWAMLLFAEISELVQELKQPGDEKILLSMIKTKVEEFPRLVIQEALNKAKHLEEESNNANTTTST